MHIAVDISLYPLTAAYLAPIRAFIDRLKTHVGLKVECNSLSTQVSGEIDTVFAVLREEIGRSFDAADRAVFVLKMVGGGA